MAPVSTASFTAQCGSCLCVQLAKWQSCNTALISGKNNSKISITTIFSRTQFLTICDINSLLWLLFRIVTNIYGSSDKCVGETQ